ATFIFDFPIEFDLEDCKLKGFDTSVLSPILEKLEFKSFLGKINDLQQRFGGKIEEKQEAKIDVINLNSSNSEFSADEDNDLWFFSASDTAAVPQQSTSPITPRIINTEAKLTELVKLLQKFTNPETPIAWDTETTDLE
ncbi:MAG: DNA polymerase I, partial [Nostoc sp.]